MVTLQLPVTLLIFRENHHLPTAVPEMVPVTGCGRQAKWIKDNLDGNIPQGLSEPVIVRYADTLGAPKILEISRRGEKVWEMMITSCVFEVKHFHDFLIFSVFCRG